MLKTTTSNRPDKQLEKNLIALVYAVVALAFCLMMLFVFPQYSLLLLILTLVAAVLSIALAIGVLNASEEALTYGGFANEILNSPKIMKRIDNNQGQPIIENEPARKFFKGGNILENLRDRLFDERQNLLNFQRLELGLKSLKKESVTLNLIRDRQEEWFTVSVRPIYLKKNDIFEEEFSIKKIQKETYFLWTLEDVTASKNMEKIFEEERKKLHRFINRMPVGIYIADTTFKLEYVNDTFAAQLLTESEKLTGRSLSEIVVQNKAMFNPQLADYGGFSFFRRSDDENVEMFVIQNSYQEGAEIKICGFTYADLPTDRELSDKLNFAEDEINNLISTSPYGIISVDAKGAPTRMNSRAAEICSLDQSEEPAVALADIFDAEAAKQLKDLLKECQTEKDFHGVKRIETRLKSEKNVCVCMAPRYIEHHSRKTFSGLTLYIMDTTEQKSLEFKFAQAQKMQAMGQLAGGIAHDFNNLLTAMIGFCDLLLQRHGIGDPSFADLIQIKQNANRAAGLVRQLLAFSRKQPLKPKCIDVTENFMELSHLMKRILGEQVLLEFNHGRDLGYIKVDPVQFSQVIINLAVNAKDAMSGKGRLDIATRVEHLSEPYQFGADTIAAGDFVVISVTDTGCGIPEENLSRIFEPFFSTKQNVVGSGTGLGLAMVYGIVRQTEGFIKVESTLGRGTTFSIYLPRFEKEDIINDQTDDSSQSIALPTHNQGAQGQKLILGLNVTNIDHAQKTYQNPQDVKILFVEDEDSVRAFGVRALKKKGFSVTACANAENALEHVRDGEKFNLLITDMVMPGMSGADLAREVSQALPEIKIILASGYSEEIARRELKGSDNFVFIAKPYSLGDLNKKVSQILEEAGLL